MSEGKARAKAARTALDAGDYEAVLEECREGLLDCDKSTQYLLLVFKGSALGKLKKNVEALGEWQRASELFPDLPLAWQAVLTLDPIENFASIYVKAACKLNDLLPEDKVLDLNVKVKERLKEKDEFLRPYIDFVTFLKDRRGAQHLKELATLWRKWEEVEVEERFRKQRYSISAGPLPALKDRLQREVMAESGLTSTLTEINDWGIADVREELAVRSFRGRDIQSLEKAIDGMTLDKASEGIRHIILDTNDSLEYSASALPGSLYEAFKSLSDAFSQERYADVIASNAVTVLKASPFPQPTRLARAAKLRAIAFCRLNRPDEVLDAMDSEVDMEKLMAFERLKRYNDAIPLANMLQVEPDRLGWLLYHARRFDEINGACVDPLLLALMKWHSKDYASAHAMFSSLEPKPSVALRNIGHYMWRIKNDADAIRAYQECLRIDPKDTEAAVAIAEILVQTTRDFQSASGILTPFEQSLPMYARYWRILGFAKLRLGMDPAGAARAFQMALRGTSVTFDGDAAEAISESSLNAWLAEAYIADDRLNAAYKILHRCDLENGVNRTILAYLCLRLDLFHEALEHSVHLKDELTCGDVFIQAHCGLFHRSRTAGTAEWRVHAEKIYTGSTFSACKAVGDVFKMIDKEKARIAYQQALKMAEHPVQRSRAYADIALLEGDEEAALEAIQANDDTWSSLAMAVTVSKVSKSQHFACKSLQHSTKNIHSWYQLIHKVYKGRDDLRNTAIEAALTSCPMDPSLHFARHAVHSYPALRQILSLDDSIKSGHREDVRGSACPAYLTDIYRAFIEAYNEDLIEDAWMAILAMQRLQSLAPTPEIAAKLATLMTAQGWPALSDFVLVGGCSK